ncbi:Cyclic nucleotide-binding domain-containing protein [Marinospirillum celere]|uniref:Cyclic nucleotide-binding domain-containing protein n=1 Tax=Marinospirillum celere TaxID=1122252 RepID=A0A1I1JIG4_9GAMM|nr:cyclic nucleotide-binding domain-containing protein [Marinospirillum celere]SFC48327.1 Cyclic nucleotide-binding domain-containing protein [Marinospirillum celere]
MKQINTLRHKIIQLLSRLEFFKSFPDTDKQLLVEGKGMIVLAEEGEYVIKQGSVDPTLYIPLSGELEVRMTNQSGKEVRIASIPPGETVGEVAFLTDSPRTASVVAVRQTVLFRCNRVALRNLAPTARERIKDQIILKLVERLEHQNRELSNKGGVAKPAAPAADTETAKQKKASEESVAQEGEEKGDKEHQSEDTK